MRKKRNDLIRRPSLWLSCGVLALGVLFFAAAPARAQVVIFPDPNFESAVRDNLGISQPTPIYQTNMLALTNISAGFRGITNLGGIEYAQNLTNLDVFVNQLANVSVLTNLPQLRFLQAAYNRLTDGSPLSALTNLYFLDLGGNNDGANNVISNAAFLAGLTNLKWLGISSSRIFNISNLVTLSGLTNLDLNFIGAISNTATLNGFSNLISLNIAADNISDLSYITHMPVLRHLDMGYDSVTNLSPIVGRQLTELLAHYNPLSNPYVVTNVPTLTLLTLSNDGLTNINFLSRMTNLVELAIDGNHDLKSLTPVLGLTNLWHLNISDSQFTNLTAVTSMTNLTYLELASMPSLQDISFISLMTNLDSLNFNDSGLANLAPLAALPTIYNLYLSDNNISDPSPLTSVMYLGYVDLRNNLINTNTGSAGAAAIEQLQNQFVYVDFDPQDLTPTISISSPPAGDCIAVGDNTQFTIAANTSAGELSYQWQFNDIDLPGQTDATLFINSAATNQAGRYRVILHDDFGRGVSEEVRLFVGDPNCGQTILVQQQPINQCAAPGDDVAFQIVATSTRTNLAYQWQFNGTNIDGETDSVLYLFSVDVTNSGFYNVLLMDDVSTNSSVLAELKVVTNVVFADANLDQLVRGSLGLGPVDPIDLPTLDNLHGLSVNSQGISDISGLECARYLNNLDLSYNPVTNLEAISWLQNLGFLNLANCNLTNISFLAGLTNLYDLNVSTDTGQPNQNFIHDIRPLAGLFKLQYLSAGYNDCPFGWSKLNGLTNLTWISVANDCVPDLSFIDGMTNLTLLDCYNNPVVDSRPITNKFAINWLSLAQNQVTNFAGFQRLTNLGTLYLSWNTNLSDVTFLTNLHALGWLAVDHSGVTNISVVAGLPGLQDPDVSYIACSNMTPVSGLTNLGSLWAGGNSAGTASFVSALTNVAWLGLELDGVSNLLPLNNLSNLIYVRLENNSITNVSVLTNKLGTTYLYLAGNQVHDLTPLKGLTNLDSLSLNQNGLSDVSVVTNFQKLTWLILQSNNVQNVSALTGLTNLHTLDLYANQITNLAALTNLGQLTFLNPGYNLLKSLPSLAGLSNLTSLDVSGNLLTDIGGLSGMQVNWVSARSNQLQTVQGVTNLPNLTSFDLGGNRLTNVVNLGAFTALNYLYLDANNLQVIDALTNLVALNYVDLTYNLLDTNVDSVAMADIGIMQSHNTGVNYLPQQQPAILSSPMMVAPNQFRFTIQTPAGAVLRIESSTDLSAWTPGIFITNGTGTTNFVDTAASGNQRFYRVRVF